jgi:hypothetical protein
MNREHERSLGSSHIEVGSGAVQYLSQEQERLDKLESARPSGSSHVEDGGWAAQRLEQLRMNLVGKVNDRDSREL